MILDFKDDIKKLKDIEQQFNHTKSATTKYALLQALNHLAEHDIKFTDKYWLKTWQDAMFREQGIEVKQ
jgi:hypothetical protein